jgi:hypothetical protein
MQTTHFTSGRPGMVSHATAALRGGTYPHET